MKVPWSALLALAVLAWFGLSVYEVGVTWGRSWWVIGWGVSLFLSLLIAYGLLVADVLCHEG